MIAIQEFISNFTGTCSVYTNKTRTLKVQESGGQNDKRAFPPSTVLENYGNLKYLHNRWQKYLKHLLQWKEMGEFTVVIKSVQLARLPCVHRGSTAQSPLRMI